MKEEKRYRILSLDGGGAKGIYTLGVLAGIEKKLGSALVNHFDGFYGCSTGALIIADMALGRTVGHATEMYLENIPRIMGCYRACSRTKALRKVLEKEFGNGDFMNFKKEVTIFATSASKHLPLIFKSRHYKNYTNLNIIEPGAYHTITEALMASCSAVPFFEKAVIKKSFASEKEAVMDGTFAAENPILAAMIDMVKKYKKSKEEIIAVSVGTGEFPVGINTQFLLSTIIRLDKLLLLDRLMHLNTNTLQIITQAFFNDYNIIRINDKFTDPSLKTNLLEHNVKKLKLLYEKGRESFARAEKKFEKTYFK